MKRLNLFFCLSLAIIFSLTFQETSFSENNTDHPNLPISGSEKNPSEPFNETPLNSNQPDPPSLTGGEESVQDLESTDEVIETEEELETLNEEEYDMPITLNEIVKKRIDYFKSSISSRFNIWLNRSGRYLSLMKEILKEEGLPQDLVYLVIIESGFNPYAYSWSKAVGYWQFISSTAKRYGLKINWWVDERRDPIKSTIAAAKYLKDLYDIFGSWGLALAAYNAGEGKVFRGLSKIRGGDFWDLRDTRYLKRETKEYVPRYMAATIIAKNPEAHGFIVDYHEPLQYDEVIVAGPIDLNVIARCAETTVEEIKAFNPELKRWCTPPYLSEYTIRIPAGTKETFLSNLTGIPEEERFTAQTYRVKKGDTLKKIAKNFGVSKTDIVGANLLGKRYRPKVGDVLLIPLSERHAIIAKSEKRGSYSKVGSKQKRIIYRIKKGDTLFKIAQRYGTTVEKIKRENSLTSNRLIPGRKLYIIS